VTDKCAWLTVQCSSRITNKQRPKLTQETLLHTLSTISE